MSGLTEAQVNQLINDKRASGTRIDPATADVWFSFGHMTDARVTGLLDAQVVPR